MDAVEVVETVNGSELAAIQRLLAAAAQSDGRAAVSEQGRLALRGPRPGVRHLLQRDGGAELVGYAQVDAAGTAELAVDPAQRRQGHGRALAAAAVDAGATGAWAHGGHPGARRLAEELGFELVRELRQMRRPLPVEGTEDAEITFPPGVELRTFRPGADDEAWLALNAAAFAHHPEQGGWTARDLADRLAEPWFDRAGFFLATRGDELVGFHWTKVEGDMGEVYVVGVGPSEQGNGLGRALTSVGLRYLGRDRGLGTVLLYVDADNPAAVRVYEKLGFTVYEVDLMYRLSSD